MKHNNQKEKNFFFFDKMCYREISGTAIPLVRVFEVREVDWARPIMAVCTILVGCLAITEILPSLYNSVIHLAGSEWGIFVSMLAYRNPLTGSPILAIFTAGNPKRTECSPHVYF